MNDVEQDEEVETFRKSMRPSQGLVLRHPDRTIWWGVGAVVLALVGFFVFSALYGKTSSEVRRHALYILDRQGYTHIKLQEVGLFQCGFEDVFNRSVGFIAIAPGGPIRGTVCCGLLRDCQVRFD